LAGGQYTRLQFPAGAGIIGRVITPRVLITVLLLSALPLHAAAADGDWPQFLGPTRDNHYAGNGLADAWPKDGPKILWNKDVGSGWSGPIVAGGKLILFHRLDDKETVECLDAASGKQLWSGDYPTAYQDSFGFDNGPRATPAIADGRVFTFGAEGMLTCWDLNTGARAWQVNTKEQYHADKGYFGMVCSPLVEGDAVILNVGGTRGRNEGAGVAAFDKTNGNLLWKATRHEAGYSSPIPATIGGKRSVLSLTRAGLVDLDPKTGDVRFEYPFRARSDTTVNAASPVLAGNDQVLLSASYGTGATLLKIDGGAKPQALWASDDALSAHYATPVIHNGYVYGFHGRQEEGCAFRCIELKTGNVKWSKDRVGAGTVLLAGDELFILHERGELIRAAASPDAFKLTGRATILKPDVRAYPALAGGLYFARDQGKLVCVDLRKH
jgi:outer membrane protein assembly factor BamB